MPLYIKERCSLVLNSVLVLVSVQLSPQSIIVNASLFKSSLIAVSLNLICMAEWSLRTPDVVVLQSFTRLKNLSQQIKLSIVWGECVALKVLYMT